MGLATEVEIRSLEATQGGAARFYTPQLSHETMLVQIPSGTVEDLFVHRFQTDQLLVVRGSLVLVILQNRQYRYILLKADQPQVAKIPPGIPHGAINLSLEPCVLVNAVIRHGSAHPRDYRPLQPPFPYNIEAAKALLKEQQVPTAA